MTELLQKLERERWYRGQVERVVEVPPRPGWYAPPPFGLPCKAQRWLEQWGIRLFSHQAEAMELILAGKDVILATGPSSGKTLAMALPILSILAEDPQAGALLLYPMKALAQDQLGKWRELVEFFEVGSLGIYDGDTPSHLRPKLRSQSKLILTNPYALHQYLEWHHLWAQFLRSLRFIVVDEAHWYQGAFGAGVALLFWRLGRVLSRYGAKPTFALASATSGDPLGLGEKLSGRRVHPVIADGSPQGRKVWWFWNPDKDERPSFQQVLDLCAFLLREGLQTLVFVPSRRMSEALSAALRKSFPELGIAAYRAGFLPEERRALEGGLREGALRLVVSTCALELGVDIGGLDAVVLFGYPGSLSSARQMSGRAGRAGRDALVIYVPEEDPLDRYFLGHPEELVFGPVEIPALNPRQRELLLRHILCAAAEAPLTPKDLAELGIAEEDLAGHVSAGLLAKSPAGWIYAGLARPQEKVALDALSGRQVLLQVDGRVLEVWDEVRARREAFPGAILLHQGQAFRVRFLDLAQGLAELEPYPGEHTTKAVITESAEIQRVEEKSLGRAVGRVVVREKVVAYKVIHRGRVVAVEPLDLPPVEYETEAVWIVWEEGNPSAGALHGAEHALVALVPLLVGCSTGDVGGVSSPHHPQTGLPTVLVYDAVPGGIGISRALFSQVSEWVKRAAEHLRLCPCAAGCPRCVFSPRCGSGNQPMDKLGAQKILAAWRRIYGAVG